MKFAYFVGFLCVSIIVIVSPSWQAALNDEHKWDPRVNSRLRAMPQHLRRAWSHAGNCIPCFRGSHQIKDEIIELLPEKHSPIMPTRRACLSDQGDGFSSRIMSSPISPPIVPTTRDSGDGSFLATRFATCDGTLSGVTEEWRGHTYISSPTCVPWSDKFKLLTSAFKSAFKFDQPFSFAFEFTAIDQTTQEIRGIILADIEQKDESTLLYYPWIHNPKQNLMMSIDYLVVSDFSHGQGVGRHLVELIEDIAWHCGFETIKLTPFETAKTFYSKLGYKMSGIDGDWWKLSPKIDSRRSNEIHTSLQMCEMT